MASQSTHRKLTAILCADVVGYSRLMGDDKEATIATLTDYRKIFVSHIESHGGRGVGSKLLALAGEHAGERNFHKLSLIVFDQNVLARRLYERLGYREVAREPVVPHPLIHVTGDANLMVKPLR